MFSTPFVKIRSKAARIINAHTCHFLALSVLFLLPLSASLISGLSILKTLLRQTYSDRSLSSNINTLMLTLSHIIFISFFSLCSIGSISYSVFNSFHGRPVKLTSSIKWILTPRFSLLATTMVSVVIVSVVLLLLAIFSFLVVDIVKMAAGFDRLDYSSLYFNLVSLVILILLLMFLLYFQVNWVLESLIVEMESTLVFRPLERSTNLGSVALYYLLFDSIMVGIFIFGMNLHLLIDYVGNINDAYWWKSVGSVSRLLLSSPMVMMHFIQNIGANTVLYIYMHSSGVHGEVAMESDEEIAETYVNLPPGDQDRAPHLVSVA